jgi:hypothetical protein
MERSARVVVLQQDIWLTYDFASTGCIGPFPFVSGTNWFTPGILPAIGGDYPDIFNISRWAICKEELNSILLQILFLNGTAVNFQPGDQIINFGNPKTQAVGNFDMLKTFQEFYEEYNGATGHSRQHYN